jgi:SAM-dependent MidA family methyltransferase
MNAAPEQAPSPHPALLAHLRGQAGPGGVLSYRDFTAAALYAPGLGYYARPGVARVGRQPNTDFYTASSLARGIFGNLVRAAAVTLLTPENPADYALVEFGAEPGRDSFAGHTAPFASFEIKRLGDALTPPPRAVVFANELLDAQPFHRFVFRRGAWRELGVNVNGSSLTEVELPEFSPRAKPLLTDLPASVAEDYHLDLSLEAETLLGELAASPWRGLLLFADYGYSWAELIQVRPAGTARAYFRHEVSNDLLARPGEQDLTCHVCWDRLEKILCKTGFDTVEVQRQEAFFTRHAATALEKLVTENAGGFSAARQTVMELLHPSHLGQKFQFLCARRR